MALEAKNPYENADLVDKEASGQLDPEESAATEPLLTEIDHIAIAVDDLPAAIDEYRDTFGAVVEHREVVDAVADVVQAWTLLGQVLGDG